MKGRRGEPNLEKQAQSLVKKVSRKIKNGNNREAVEIILNALKKTEEEAKQNIYNLMRSQTEYTINIEENVPGIYNWPPERITVHNKNSTVSVLKYVAK